MEVASIIIAMVSVVFTFVTYVVTVRYEKIKATIEAINLLQNEVLDGLVNRLNRKQKILNWRII